MPPFELIERTRLFALDVLKFCRRLPTAAEAQEAEEAQSRCRVDVEQERFSFCHLEAGDRSASAVPKSSSEHARPR